MLQLASKISLEILTRGFTIFFTIDKKYLLKSLTVMHPVVVREGISFFITFYAVFCLTMDRIMKLSYCNFLRIIYDLCFL